MNLQAMFPIEKFDVQKICVLIPTYNNAQTIAQVIQDITQYSQHIIVVNDGSTDNTPDILSQFPFIHIVSYSPNQGKGKALQNGFKYALSKGYEYAITIDSDGQHYAKDIPTFVSEINKHPRTLIIGARNMNQEHVPGKSSFGNKFSNFWFWVETGIHLPDTQSGYRLYPLEPLKDMLFFTSKYEFEIEAPVRLAWKGIKVTSVPISVYYPPADERITHFRPFKDFTRISILNTFLTLTALLWIHPRNFILQLTHKDGWKKLKNQIFNNPNESKQHKAASIAFGVFMGIVPIWGAQLLIGIPLAMFLKLNKVLFLIAANISIFPITPIWWGLSLLTGKILLGYHDWHLHLSDMTLQQFKEAGIAFFLGGAVLAILMAAIAYLLSIIVMSKYKASNK